MINPLGSHPDACAYVSIQKISPMYHCVKSVQILWSVFSCIRTEYGPEKTPYLDTLHAVY